MLEIKHLTKYYDEKIIDDLNVTFDATGLVVIVGESGCGKTTLLNLIGGLDHDYQGEILLDHQNIRDIKKYCRKHIGFIFQNFNLINWLRVKENYYLPKFFRGILPKRAIENHEDQLELTKLKRKKISFLSGGQLQRVSMLRAMIKDVDILLCDEPTGCLDDNNAKIIFELLKQLSSERLVIVITHNQTLANRYGDLIYALKQGKLITTKVIDNYKYSYPRLKQTSKPLSIFNLALKQYRANFSRNINLTLGIMLALICIMITFTLSDSLHRQIQKQLNIIFPMQLISVQSKDKQPINYLDVLKLSKEKGVKYCYVEPRDYEFMGISTNSKYDLKKTVYISDMTKPIRQSKLLVGRLPKNSHEIVLTKSTAIHLKDNYQQLLNQEISGFYLNNQTVKSTALTIVGITNEITPLDTIYISQLANLKQIKEIYQNDDIALQLAMINLDVKADAKTLIKEFKQEYPRLKFKIAGENISQKADQLINQVQAILFLFSLLAIVAACFLIGEVLYLSVVEKTKDIGIFKCLGASKLQIMILVLLESFIIITFGYLGAYLILKQIINLINEFVVKGLSLSLTTSFIEIDYFLLILIYLISLFLGLISSLFPAVYASKIDCVKALKYHQY